MHKVKFIIPLLITILFIVALNTRIGDIPPMGAFLDPFHGFWQNAERTAPVQDLYRALPGLQEQATVAFDERRVPHIFAGNQHDLYMLHGYITARHRLWQMEFQVHAAAGRISEIIGEQAVEYDRFQRRLGMVEGAEQSVEAMRNNPDSRKALEAYTEGVNAYIESLDRAQYPLEYKVLDYEPEPWTPLKTGLLLMNMAQTLTGHSSAASLTRAYGQLEEELFGELYPVTPPYAEPYITGMETGAMDPLQATPPDSAFTPRILGDPGRVPPELGHGPTPGSNGDRFELASPPIFPETENRTVGAGSNNWAVDGSRTRSGHPLLAYDPHQSLSIPALWYEVHLNSPEMNVYGATIPGAPVVVTGFNEHIAWGQTNAGSDVMDLHEIEFRDERRDAYYHDGEWLETRKEPISIEVRGSEAVQDTIIYTHHGPVTVLEDESPFEPFVPPDHAVRWSAHEASNEVLALQKINRADDYESFVEGLEHFEVPAQTYIYADREDNIALWHNGRLPVRWSQQGRFISDGRDPAHDWQAWLPHDHLPHERNPEKGYLASANQLPVDEAYPYYLGWDYAGYERGTRVHNLLAQSRDTDTAFHQRMQLDNHSLHAERSLPLLLEQLDLQALNAGEQELMAVLQEWDHAMDPAEIAPSLFSRWWEQFHNTLWDYHLTTPGQDHPVKRPRRDVTVDLLENRPQAEVFQINGEHALADMVTEAFRKAVQHLEEQYGEVGESWQWGHVQGAEITHLADIPGLGLESLFKGGSNTSINALKGDHGPSWRMVVDLEPPVSGYGVYPGGQTGNPGSPAYDEFVDTWAEGELYELHFPSDEQQAEHIARYRIHFSPH